MVNRSKKDSLIFAALKKLYNKQDCDAEQKKQLKKHNLINQDCTLTIRGKTVVYATILDIPVESFKILALCYTHRKSQTYEKLIPVFYELIESFFGGKSNSNMYECIKYLTDNNLTEKYSCRSLMITDSAYDELKQYDADIVEIESTFEY